MNWIIVDDIIKKALEEDCTFKDITTSSIVKYNSNCQVELIDKENGIIAGLEVFERVFNILGGVNISFNKKDGDYVNVGEVIGTIKGNAHNILVGERVALNFLQRMSGIATTTYKAVNLIVGTKAKILDTRKTTPNLRILEKYAVTVGGGYNHRFNLSDGVLIKDNHIDAAGGITEAIKRVKNNIPFGRKIEVEAENLEQVKEALEAGADIIMLDNMNIDMMEKAVKLVDKRCATEASGNISLDNINSIANTGVDFISLGMLTHTIKSLDISMKNLIWI
ncbi:carboxylating nicotinate-nucleotide diphosphorylase [Anaerosalibacter sp. Marseille-P3206]|uniref:carboxylating nicotinate-nucleotide diphosphorylase n=1 Tax=Anaerosalibacter sp. Marseille-P3206 TaxID=1871005 RepID=UPI000984BFD0|nr:carboxylating nicotinate-nucleotide diphosphorylase [Anaerosalibacter sp. Marseille-P3206]